MCGCVAFACRRLATAPAGVYVVYRTTERWAAWIMERVTRGHVRRVQVSPLLHAPLRQCVFCEPSLARPSETICFVRARRSGCVAKFTLIWRAQLAPRLRIIFGLAAGPHATCVIMAQGHVACTLRNSLVPCLNRVTGTLSRAFSTRAQLSPSPCHASAAGRSASPSSIISLSFLSFAVSSLRSVLRALRIVPRRSASFPLTLTQSLHFACFAWFAALLFFSKRKERRE